MSVTKALSDENRVRTILALRNGELCVCQIVELLQLAPSTVSKHMSILRQARLVNTRKDGRWVYYSLDPVGSDLHRPVIDWLCESLWATPEAASDRRKLQQIICMEPQVLCQIQRTST
jgi:ArsR family transcriptional regulator, arsenate/arsenite/antimonite-responsive transcriptional repressor